MNAIPILEAICSQVEAAAPTLNELDAFAGDGDLGVTVAAGAGALARAAPNLQFHDIASLLKACGELLARTVPSTIGTLTAAGLLEASRAPLEGADAPYAFVTILEAVTTAVSQTGGAELGAKTMLDALGPATSAGSSAAAQSAELAVTLDAAAAGANAGARATATMQAQHGRAGWLAARSSGHEDAGARFVAIVLTALAQSVRTYTPASSPRDEGEKG